MEYLFSFMAWWPYKVWYRIYYFEDGVYYAAYQSHHGTQYYDREMPDFYFTRRKKWVSEPEVRKDTLEDLVNELIHFKVMNNWKEK